MNKRKKQIIIVLAIVLLLILINEYLAARRLRMFESIMSSGDGPTAVFIGSTLDRKWIIIGIAAIICAVAAAAAWRKNAKRKGEHVMQGKLMEFAKVIVQVGVNLQKGQTLVITCPIECAEFGRLVAEEAYSAGAREVVMRWGDDLSARIKFLRADDAVFDEIAEWLKTFYYEYANQKAAVVHIAASDPEYLKGVEPDRLRRSAVVSGRELKEDKEIGRAHV